MKINKLHLPVDKHAMNCVFIAGIYFIISVTWVLLSDYIAAMFFDEKILLSRIFLYKEWGLIILSTLLIGWLIGRTFLSHKKTNQLLVEALEKEKSLHKKLDTNVNYINGVLGNLGNPYSLQQPIYNDNGCIINYCFLDVNSAFEKMVNKTRVELIGNLATDVFTTDSAHIDSWISYFSGVALGGRPAHMEKVSTKSGAWYNVDAFSVCDGEFLALFTNITTLVEQQEELRQQNEQMESARLKEREKSETLIHYQQEMHSMVYKDEWTELPNRRALKEYLQKCISDNPESSMSMIYMDLDNFKLVNDVHGHSFGDAFIRSVAERLKITLPKNWILYRMGGDEFIGCSDKSESLEETIDVAQILLRAFDEPLKIGSTSIHGSLSLGMAQYPDHANNSDNLLKYADIAMYKAKKIGKNCSVMFEQSMIQPINDRYHMEEALCTALQNNEFTLHYQAQFDFVSERISGFEALLRWNSATLGHVSPASFIPIAEEARHIIPIGEWVMRQACFFLKKIHEAGFPDLKIAVNVSILQLVQTDFVNTVVDIIDSVKLPPESLELEITESILMESKDQVLPILYMLREKGFGISLDDFGQGYSSLSYLMDMPITVLKIDKLFVDAIDTAGPGRKVLGSIMELGHHLSFHIIAEGVETLEQKECLELMDCDSLQGYWFSKPLPEEEAYALFIEHENNRDKKKVVSEIASYLWKSAYSIGDDLLDKQHQIIFDIIRRLVLSLNNPTDQYNDSMFVILEELIEYLSLHFTTEENYLQKKNYTALQSHQTEHKFLIATISGFCHESAQEADFDLLSKRVGLVSKWVIRHILVEDRKYGNALKLVPF